MELPKSNFQNSMQYRSQRRKERLCRRSRRKSLKKSEIKLQSFEIMKQTIFGKIGKSSIKPSKKSLSRVMKACKAAEKRGPRESERIERLNLVTSSGLNKDFESIMEGLNQKVSALTTQDLDEDILSYEDMEMMTTQVQTKFLYWAISSI